MTDNHSNTNLNISLNTDPNTDPNTDHADNTVAHTFLVTLPQFTGTLSELSVTLQKGKLDPSEVPLLRLTRELLQWAQEVTGQQPVTLANSHPDLLPMLANVIALKARLLLPPPDTATNDEWNEDAEWTEWAEGTETTDPTLDGVEMLAELETLVSFLSGRRKQREGVIAVRGETPKLPRKERKPNPKRSLAKLFAVAQQAVKHIDVSVPLLARERLSLNDALSALRAFGSRLKQFCFDGVPAQNWSERTTYFAALLEGVKEGTFAIQQTQQFGNIDITHLKSTEAEPTKTEPTETVGSDPEHLNTTHTNTK